jgi:hypothetical protein
MIELNKQLLGKNLPTSCGEIEIQLVNKSLRES